ncbi:hypothetical protein [Rhizobium sp. SJZ105]|uniref:hypothetical protein n=1 Tax=Rhizobium sp. SJZ105 TaxID=2572678 RepID=UPI001645DDD0|nr:hypothetical protein [Rhizobium sp. SJZ105]
MLPDKRGRHGGYRLVRHRHRFGEIVKLGIEPLCPVTEDFNDQTVLAEKGPIHRHFRHIGVSDTPAAAVDRLINVAINKRSAPGRKKAFHVA